MTCSRGGGRERRLRHWFSRPQASSAGTGRHRSPERERAPQDPTRSPWMPGRSARSSRSAGPDPSRATDTGISSAPLEPLLPAVAWRSVATCWARRSCELSADAGLTAGDTRAGPTPASPLSGWTAMTTRGPACVRRPITVRAPATSIAPRGGCSTTVASSEPGALSYAGGSTRRLRALTCATGRSAGARSASAVTRRRGKGSVSREGVRARHQAM